MFAFGSHPQESRGPKLNFTEYQRLSENHQKYLRFLGIFFQKVALYVVYVEENTARRPAKGRSAPRDGFHRQSTHVRVSRGPQVTPIISAPYDNVVLVLLRDSHPIKTITSVPKHASDAQSPLGACLSSAYGSVTYQWLTNCESKPATQ